MKLNVDNHGFKSCLPEEQTLMTIETSAKMFEILSSGIYKDKIKVVIREYSANAYDSHIAAGKREVPFVVQLPSTLDPTFSVTDYGTGIPPDQIAKIYWTYGRSSKTEDQEQIGALGLGSKSAFAYTRSSFIVKNRWNGTEYVYFCFINEGGLPGGSTVSEAPTDEPNGVTVEFAVRPADIDNFVTKTQLLFKNWQGTLPIVKGNSSFSFINPNKVIEGARKDWYLEKFYGQRASAIMGNIQYPIDFDSIPNLPDGLKIIVNSAFVVNFPMGDLEFSASREELSYTEFTCAKIIKRLQEVASEYCERFTKKIFESTTLVDFYHNFNSTFNSFKESVTLDGYKTGSKSSVHDDQYLQLLFNKTSEDYITFNGVNFKIRNILLQRLEVHIPQLTPFTVLQRMRGVRSVTDLIFTAARELSITEINVPEYFRHVIDNKIPANTTIYQSEWKPFRIKHKNPSYAEYLHDCFENKLVDIETVITIGMCQTVEFVINDVGSSGRDRFKMLSHRFLIDFDKKAYTVEQITEEVKKFIDAHLQGAKISLLSALPDNRKPIDREKLDKEQVKLKFYDLMISQYDTTVHIDNGVLNKYVPYKVNALSRERITDEIVELSSLMGREVLYIVKRHSTKKFYRQFDSDYTFSDSYISLLNTEGIFDDQISVITHGGAPRKVIRFLIINEGQYNYLKKKGVKLISVEDRIFYSVKKFEDPVMLAEIADLVTLNQSESHSRFRFVCGDAELQSWQTSDSLFKREIAKYHEAERDLENLDSATVEKIKKIYLMTVFLNFDFESTIKTEVRTRELYKVYPMLKIVSYTQHSKTILLDYIEMIDESIKKAVSQAQKELREESLLAA